MFIEIGSPIVIPIGSTRPFASRRISEIAVDKCEAHNSRVGAINWLSLSADVKAIPPLQTVAIDETDDNGIREWSIYGLGNLISELPKQHTDESDLQILECLRDYDDEGISVVAKKALETIRGENLKVRNFPYTNIQVQNLLWQGSKLRRNWLAAIGRYRPNYCIDGVKIKSSYKRQESRVDELSLDQLNDLVDRIFKDDASTA